MAETKYYKAFYVVGYSPIGTADESEEVLEKALASVDLAASASSKIRYNWLTYDQFREIEDVFMRGQQVVLEGLAKIGRD